MLQKNVIDAVPLNEVTTPILEEPDYSRIAEIKAI